MRSSRINWYAYEERSTRTQLEKLWNGNSIATAAVAKWEGELLPAAEAEAFALTLDVAVPEGAPLKAAA